MAEQPIGMLTKAQLEAIKQWGDALYERYAKHLESEHRGEFVVISSMVPFHPTVVELGDGSLRLTHEHRGVIEIGQARFRATVLFLGNEYLLGREIVDRMRICFHWGERLEVEFQRQ